MISIGTIKDVRRVILTFSREHYFDKSTRMRLEYYARKHHRIGGSDKYNLTGLDITCKVFNERLKGI